MKYFTREHEWVEIVDGVGTVGISIYAADELGDITFIELPELGALYRQGDVASVVESVKAASDIYAPVSGTVKEVNEGLRERPEVMNESAEKEGWIFRLENINEDELSSLMDEAAYQTYVAEEKG